VKAAPVVADQVVPVLVKDVVVLSEDVVTAEALFKL